MTTRIVTNRIALALVVCVLTLVSCSPTEKAQGNSASDPEKRPAALGVSLSGAVVDAGPMPIDPTGTPVNSDTKLGVGDKLQVKWKGPLVFPNGKSTNESWWNGEVIACNPNGSVKIRYTGWRSEWDEVVSRDRLLVPKK